MKTRGSARCSIKCLECGAVSPVFTYRLMEEDDGEIEAFQGRNFPLGWWDEFTNYISEDKERAGYCPEHSAAQEVR